MVEQLSTNKKTKEISVDTMYQLCVGKSAKLVIGREMIVTSPVVAVYNNNRFSNNSGFAMFDTKNTRYIVHFRNYAA